MAECLKFIEYMLIIRRIERKRKCIYYLMMWYFREHKKNKNKKIHCKEKTNRQVTKKVTTKLLKVEEEDYK